MASQHRVQELFDRVARGGQQGVIEYLHGLANTTQTTTGQLLGAMRDDIGRSALHIAARHGDVGKSPSSSIQIPKALVLVRVLTRREHRDGQATPWPSALRR